jgi:hypothetical protein
LGFLLVVLKTENSKAGANPLILYFLWRRAPFRLSFPPMNKPKTLMLWGAAAVAAVGALSFPAKSSGQAAGDEQAIAQLVTEIAEQHNKIANNQQTIDVKVAAIAEQLRVARIFVSRGGGKK